MSYVDHSELLVEVQDLAAESKELSGSDLEECIAGAIARLEALLDSGDDQRMLQMIDRVQARLAILDEELGVSDDDAFEGWTSVETSHD